jgi:hypothetical protein
MTIGAGVTLLGFPQEDWHFTFNLASGITKADEGKAVAFDGTNPNQVKLAAADEAVLGVLISVENRVQEGILVGTVALKGTFLLTTDGTTVNVGDQVQGGATAGLVKAMPATLESAAGAVAIKATSHQKSNMVVEKPTSTTAVVVLL